MSIEKANLRKLLQLFYAADRQQRRLLREDIRNDRRRESGGRDEGGDFYSPFWADVKSHVAGHSALKDQSGIRIAANKSRARLYPVLTDCFLTMWSEKMRWRNEPFEWSPSLGLFPMKKRTGRPELSGSLAEISKLLFW